MPEYCTCGAELPPDARFCHKCGKPQREEPLIHHEEAPVPAIVVPVPPPMAPPPIDFHNRFAVRLGFFVALLADFLVMTPYLVYGFPIWLLAGGFACVYLYTRRTGQTLSVRSGARMGWITGLFSFAIFTVFSTISFVTDSGKVQKMMHEQLAQMHEKLAQMPAAQSDAAQVLHLLESPAGLMAYMLLALAIFFVFVFVLFTMIPIAGGALGAKVLNHKD